MALNRFTGEASEVHAFIIIPPSSPSDPILEKTGGLKKYGGLRGGGLSWRQMIFEKVKAGQNLAFDCSHLCAEPVGDERDEEDGDIDRGYEVEELRRGVGVLAQVERVERRPRREAPELALLAQRLARRRGRAGSERAAGERLDEQG